MVRVRRRENLPPIHLQIYCKMSRNPTTQIFFAFDCRMVTVAPNSHFHENKILLRPDAGHVIGAGRLQRKARTEQ